MTRQFILQKTISDNPDLTFEECAIIAMELYSQQVAKEAAADGWVSVINELPPFDEKVFLRGHIDWKRGDDRVVYFADKLTRQEEDLDYGQSAYLLDDKTDFLVSQDPLLKEVCQEYITHWKKIIPLPL